MSVALEQFVKQLEDSGVISHGKLENFIPPKAAPRDAQELARQLVQCNQLTKYQAQEIYQGRAKSLILGNYTILDKIGAGGMGQVFKAEHRRMHRLVAIKMLPKNLAKSASAVARFQREVEAAAQLRHANIVATDDADEAGDVHFLVMEYIDGTDLSALVKRGGPPSIGKAVNYTLQAARGLEFAHKKGIIHRDIKPSNLLLDASGAVKVLDMGLARFESDFGAATQAELTGSGAVMGTVDYMAPEQALSTKHADARADIYSLGCTLHFLLIGKPAYDGETVAAKLLAHHQQPVPDLCQLREDVPEPLQAIFAKMVAKKIDDRYQTMSEVVAALESLEASMSGARTSLSIQQPVAPESRTDILTFLRNVTVDTIQKAKFKTTANKSGKKKIPAWIAVGAALLSLAVLAAVVFKMRTKDGTLIVEVDQPDAIVQVDGGKIEINQPGGKDPISISVDPGKHSLKVEKDGFRFFAQEFEMDSGGTLTIKAKLEPSKNGAQTPVVQSATIPPSALPPIATSVGLSQKPWNTPAFQKWMNEVSALPAEKQVEAVAKKLQDLNPGFDGKEAHKIQDGVVKQLRLASDQISDISPLRALLGLKDLNLSAGKFNDWTVIKNVMLADLSPLQGMRLSHLRFLSTRVSDLSPLKGMPLVLLDFTNSRVSDLSPLEGMRLTSLNCGGTLVSDLTPIRGMPLISLSCQVSHVSDLSPLAGAPLKELNCMQTKVTDLAPLQGMSLEGVILTPANITNGIDLIRAMTSLKLIGVDWEAQKHFTPEEFWKKYDAGEFGKHTAPQPALPPTVGPDAPPAPVAADSRLPIPAEKARLDAKQLFRNLYQADIAKAKQPEQKSALAEQLLKQADAAQDDPTSRYVILQEALRLGVDAADAAILERAISSLAVNYVVDGPQTWIDSLEKAAQKARSAAVHKRLAEVALDQLEKATADENYDLATRFHGVAHAAAQKAHDVALVKLAAERGKSLAAAKQEWSAAQKAAAVLAKSPDDPAANLALGKYLCFIKGDWQDGFARLAKSKDPVLAKLAVQSLTNPAEAAAQESIGDAWWKAAEATNNSANKAELRLGSAYWYSTALPGLTGLSQTAVKQRLESLPAIATRSTAEKPAGKQPDDPFVEFDGVNGFWASPGAPDEAINRLKKVQGNRGELKSFAFTPAGDWIFLFDSNGFYTNKLDLPACQKLIQLNQNRGIGFNCVAFAPNGGWTVLWNQNGNWSQSAPGGAMKKMQEISKAGGTLRSVAYGPNGAWVVMYGETGVAHGSVPARLAKVLDDAVAKRLTVSCVDFFGNDWICRTSGGWSTSNANAPASKLIARNTKLGLQPKWIAVRPALPTADTHAAIQPGVPEIFPREKSWGTPAFRMWSKQVATLPAEQQVAAVRKKLLDLNPDFDGRETHKIESDVVTEFEFRTDNVTDISPLRALTGLRAVRCNGSGSDKGILVDLSPLKGMALNSLDCGWNRVVDLSPLQGMPLTLLHCGGTRVSDLSPLKGAPLQFLYVDKTSVSDLSPLKGMLLTTLNLGGTPIADLSLLKGMPLTDFDCGATQVFDLSPLHGMPLRILNSSQNPRITDLSAREGMKLTNLFCNNTNVSDLSPLKGMPLIQLYCSDTQVTDLSPLAGMSLDEIVFSPQRMRTGLAALRRMPSLRKLHISPFDGAEIFNPAGFWRKYDAGEFK